MFGNLALNLSVDAGLSLVNDVMNAVSESASSQPLSLSGGAGAGYGSSGFGGQESFGEMLNNSIDNLSNAASAVLGGNQNQSPAVQPQPASGSSNPYGSQLNNASDTAAPTSVSTAERQANAGVNSGGNNSAGSRTGNNIGDSSSNNISSSGQPANNTVNAGTNSGNNASSGATKASNSSEGRSAGGTANGNSQKTSNSAGSSSKHSVKHDTGNNAGSTGSGNLADAQAVYFMGNTNANIDVHAPSSKKGDNAASGKAEGTGAGGANVKPGAKTPLSAADALLSNSPAGLNSRQSQSADSQDGGNFAGNSSGKTFLSAFSDNAGRKIADNAAVQSAPVKTGDTADKNAVTGNNQNNQNILNKITENKTNAAPNASIASNASASVKSAVSNANTANTNTVNTANANAKTLIKDAAVNALNLSVLSGEAKPALSAADGKNIESLSAGASKAGDSGSVSSSLFDAAGSAVSASAGSGSASASGGNSGGFGLTGGGVSGLEDGASGETSGSTAINSVMFMLRKNVQSATITLNPASLGTVKINISLSGANSALNPLNQSAVSNGSITVNMLAQNEAAKNILQSSSDSLQNALKNQGFSSINLNISTGSGYNNGNENNGSGAFKNPFAGVNYNGGYSNGSQGQETVSAAINNLSTRNPNALVDYFV